MSKAARTRQHLQETALRLFEERGFDAVTVEEITTAAGVSHMTFYRNFPTKESAVFDDPYDPLIGEAVKEQPLALTPISRVARSLSALASALDPAEDAVVRRRVRLAIDSPSLRARVWENNQRTQDVIVAALISQGVDRAESNAAAGAVLGAMTASLIDWAGSGADSTLSSAIVRSLAILDTSVEVVS